MEIKYLCPYWGSEEYQPNTFIHYVKDKGYDGIEINERMKDYLKSQLS